MSNKTSLDPVIQQHLDELALHRAKTEASRLLQGRLSHEQSALLVELSATHSQAELARRFGISQPAVSYHLKRHGVDAQRTVKLTAEAKAFITTSDIPAARLARMFDVTPAAIYAIWRSKPDADTTATLDRVGYKVTKAQLATILQPGLSAMDAARETGLSLPTIYNYRRAHKTALAPTVTDLV
jgi:DNA-binding CsgD family transcriptional regulator